MSWDTSDRRSFLPSDWEVRRQKRFKMDGFRCTARLDDGTRCTAAAEECDHIGDREDHRLEKLRSLCRWHHGKKTAADANRAYWKIIKENNQRFRRTEAHPGLR